MWSKRNLVIVVPPQSEVVVGNSVCPSQPVTSVMLPTPLEVRLSEPWVKWFEETEGKGWVMCTVPVVSGCVTNLVVMGPLGVEVLVAPPLKTLRWADADAGPALMDEPDTGCHCVEPDIRELLCAHGPNYRYCTKCNSSP